MSKHGAPLFAFFGTPRFAVVVLDALEARGLLPALVVTAPDKPRGRGLELSPSPVKEWAQERGIDVMTPATLKDEALVAELGNTEWDVFVVAAYNKLIPKTILDIPHRGSLNIHPSLLPKFRGPSPALTAILEDERTTGVSVMQMTPEMDAGPIVAQAKVELEEDAWPPKGQLFEDLLATEGGNLLAEVLPDWLAGEITPEEQDASKATFTRKFTDEDARIDLSGDARQNLLKIRAFDHGPRAYYLDEAGKRIIITEAEVRDGTLEILKVIPEGKKEMLYKDFQGR
ncbi:MAG TPA: methionyl-tRNA formyltransferase [Candidatus Paceibacterota bacterium]|nr:methionyl-tRNA formyltransferase [Candidatus Paceibacterota bacterium]